MNISSVLNFSQLNLIQQLQKKKKSEVKTAEPFISTHLKKIDFLVEVLASLP